MPGGVRERYGSLVVVSCCLPPRSRARAAVGSSTRSPLVAIPAVAKRLAQEGELVQARALVTGQLEQGQRLLVERDRAVVVARCHATLARRLNAEPSSRGSSRSRPNAKPSVHSVSVRSTSSCT